MIGRATTVPLPGDGVTPFAGMHPYKVIGIVMLLSLQVQSMPFLTMKVQMLPPSSVLAVLFLPFVLQRIPRSPLLIAVMVFAAYAVVHASIGLFIDLMAIGNSMRFFAWARQFFAVVGGVATFVVMRKAFMHMTDREIITYIFWGTVPALAVAMLNILWGAMRQSWAGVVVKAIHTVIAPNGYTGAMRATGLSSEPAMFAAVLAIVVIPALLVVFGSKTHKLRHLLLLAISCIAFTWTFSSVGIILIFFLILFGVFLGPSKKILGKIFVGFALFLAMFVSLFPNNQIFRHAGMLLAGGSNSSYVDRLYGIVGPFMRSFSSLTMLGYGLGGTATHFSEVVPKEQLAEILSVRWKELPGLSSLIGRIYAETGILGLIFFAFYLYITLREVHVAMRRGPPQYRGLLLAAARLGFLVTVIATNISLGSFHLPYLWLWMAVIDSRFIMSAPRGNAGETNRKDAEHTSSLMLPM